MYSHTNAATDVDLPPTCASPDSSAPIPSNEQDRRRYGHPSSPFSRSFPGLRQSACSGGRQRPRLQHFAFTDSASLRRSFASRSAANATAANSASLSTGLVQDIDSSRLHCRTLPPISALPVIKITDCRDPPQSAPFVVEGRPVVLCARTRAWGRVSGLVIRPSSWQDSAGWRPVLQGAPWSARSMHWIKWSSSNGLLRKPKAPASSACLRVCSSR